jgi:hypothetical protein
MAQFAPSQEVEEEWSKIFRELKALCTWFSIQVVRLRLGNIPSLYRTMHSERSTGSEFSLFIVAKAPIEPKGSLCCNGPRSVVPLMCWHESGTCPVPGHKPSRQACKTGYKTQTTSLKISFQACTTKARLSGVEICQNAEIPTDSC